MNTRRLAPDRNRPKCRTSTLLAAGACALVAACSGPQAPPGIAGSPRKGAEAITRMACGSCHEIPGIGGASGKVGPSLAGFGQQQVIAGYLANSQTNLERYLLHPQAIVPGNVMPDEGLAPEQARDISAYLLALR